MPWELGIPQPRKPPAPAAAPEPLREVELEPPLRVAPAPTVPTPPPTSSSTRRVPTTTKRDGPERDDLARLIPHVRARLVARFPHAVRADVRRISEPVRSAGVEGAMWMIQKLMRALLRVHASGVTSADIAAVFSILLERTGEGADRVSLVVRLAPWVTPELIRADMEDATSGGGARCVAYALFTALREREPRLHVVRHRGRWCLVVHAFYTSGRWVDAYVIPLSASTKGAAVSLHAGVREVHLDMADHVLSARAESVSKMDALFVAAHAMRASGATPVVPGSHVLSELRDMANAAHSEKLRDLLPLMQDPYEQAFTAYHTHIQAFARQGLVGGHVGAYYARNLITTLKLSGLAGELDTDSGPLCLIIRPHHDQHYRVASYERDVQHLVGRLDADVSDEVDEAMDALMYEVLADMRSDEFGALRDAKRQSRATTTTLKKPPSEAESFAALTAGNGSPSSRQDVATVTVAGAVASAVAVGAPMFLGLLAVTGTAVVGGTVYGAYNLSKWLVARAKRQYAHATRNAYAAFFLKLAGTGLTDASVAMVAPPTHIAFHVLEFARTSFPGGLASFQHYVYARLAIDVAGDASKTADTGDVAALYMDWVKTKGSDEMEFWRGAPAAVAALLTQAQGPGAKGDKPGMCVRDAVARYRLMAIGLPTLAGDYEAASDVYWLLVAYYDCVSRRSARNAGRMYEESAGRMLYGTSDTIGLMFECADLMSGRGGGKGLYPLDAVPLGACVYSKTDAAEYMVWVRSGDRTFDAYAVRAYDSEIDLGNNRTVALAELVEQLNRGGVEVRGPLYAAMDVLNAERRNETHVVVARAVAPVCTFRPAAILSEMARARLDGVDKSTWDAYNRLSEETDGVLRRNAKRAIHHLTANRVETALVATVAATAALALTALPIAALGGVTAVGVLCYYGKDSGMVGAVGAVRSVRASLRGLMGGMQKGRISSAMYAGLLPHVERYIKQNTDDETKEEGTFNEVYDPMSLSAESLQVAQPAIRHATRLLLSMRGSRCTVDVNTTPVSQLGDWETLFS